MDDLVTWLRAQLDEDERACRSEGHDGPCINYHGQDPADYDEHDSCVRHLERYRPYSDPQRGLAEVEAKRRIVDYFAEDAATSSLKAQAMSREEWLLVLAARDTIKALALPYADRPGYREEWKP